ncbi:MAG: M56 family metallopeptidase [Acidobacteriota bacterium]|nr:M56 family metallopeptidase [Acidobacteriota bacterium]
MTAWTNFVAVGGKGFVWLLAWSWQTLLLLGGVWLALKLCRVKSPALRHHVWLASLIAVALLPLLATALERLPMPQSNSRALAYVPTIPQPTVFIELPMATVTASDAATTAATSKTPVIVAALLAVGFGLWAVGVLISLLQFGRQQYELRRLCTETSPVSPAELGCADLALPANLELRRSSQIASPVLLGVRRPMILLPADIAEWTTADERRAMIRHELAHLVRRDHLTNLFQNLLGVALYFHPMARLACRQLQIEREFACDDEVLVSGVDATLYAESILKAAEHSLLQHAFLASAPSGVHQLALFSTRKTLERRVEMILNPDRIRVVTRQWRYLILPVALIVAASIWLVPGRTAKSSALAKSPEQAVADATRQIAEVVQKNGLSDVSVERTANSLKPSNNDEQTLIELVQRVIDGIPERKYGDENLQASDFVDVKGGRLAVMLTEFKGHDFEIKKVVADDFEVILHEGWATVTFNAVIRAQNLATGDYAKEEPIRYNVRLKNDNGRWWVDRSNEWVELTQKFKPAPPPPPPPPKQPGTVPAPPPPPPPPLLAELPNKDYNFQAIGQEGYSPVRWLLAR